MSLTRAKSAFLTSSVTARRSCTTTSAAAGAVPASISSVVVPAHSSTRLESTVRTTMPSHATTFRSRSSSLSAGTVRESDRYASER